MYYTFLLVQSSLLLCQQLAFRAPFLPCLLFVFLFPFLGSKETKEKDFIAFWLVSPLLFSLSCSYLFTLEGQLPRLKFILVPLLFLYSMSDTTYNFEKKWKLFFSCTKFLNRLFRPLRDEMLASHAKLKGFGL